MRNTYLKGYAIESITIEDVFYCNEEYYTITKKVR